MAVVKELGHSRAIQVFLWCVAALFLCAFTSLYAQIPGLYGKSGLYPAEYILDDKSTCHDNDRRCRQWSKQKQCQQNAEWMLENCAKSCNACKSGLEKHIDFPTLLWYTPHLGLTTETGMEFICLLGILLSFYMLLSRSARDSLNYLFLWVLYFSLVQVGQVFLYYQWDNLLLEISFFASLLAPWNLFIGAWNLFKCTRVHVYIQRDHDLITWWLIKWLLFRLMFASGIVKLLWMDEAWWHLTALNWHYESQHETSDIDEEVHPIYTKCIPTPIAWYMQKLPIPFHRISVVVTYLIEIIVPFLFFLPIRSIRIFGFFSQMLLQTMIFLTGNYNFFNLSTMALCLSLVDDNFLTFNSDLGNCCKSIKMRFQRERSEKDEKFIEAEQENEIKKQNLTAQTIFKMSSTWSLCRTKLLDWIEKRCTSKKILQIKTLVESKPVGILRNLIVALAFLGTVALLLAVAVVQFGVRYDKHEFLHTEIKFTPKWFQQVLPSLLSVSIVIGLVSLSFEIISAAMRCVLKDYGSKLKIVAFAQTVLFGFLALWIFGLTLVPLTDLDLQARNSVPKIFIKQHSMIEKYKFFNAYGLFRSMTGIGGRPEVVIMGSDRVDANSTWKEYNFIYKPGDLYSAPTFNAPHQPRLDWQMWFSALEDYMSNPWFIHLTYKLLNGDEAVLDLMSRNPFKGKPPKYIRSVLFRYHFTRNHSNIFDAVFRHSSDRRWWSREYVAEYMPVVSKNATALTQALKSYGLIRATPIREKTGLFHKFIVSLRIITRVFRAEFLIYVKFGFLILILAVQCWWKNYGMPGSQAKRVQMEETLKRTLGKFAAKN